MVQRDKDEHKFKTPDPPLPNRIMRQRRRKTGKTPAILQFPQVSKPSPGAQPIPHFSTSSRRLESTQRKCLFCKRKSQETEKKVSPRLPICPWPCPPYLCSLSLRRLLLPPSLSRGPEAPQAVGQTAYEGHAEARLTSVCRGPRAPRTQTAHFRCPPGSPTYS